MAVIGHPERLATLLTTLFQRGQRLLMRRFQTRGSSSHRSSPVVLLCLLLLSDYTCCQVLFAIQRFFWRRGCHYTQPQNRTKKVHQVQSPGSQLSDLTPSRLLCTGRAFSRG